MLAGVPGRVIRATWRLVGGGEGLGIAVADDGERIARDRAATDDRHSAQQNGMQGNRVDRRPAY